MIRDDENQDQGCVLKQANWVHFNFMLSLNKNYIQMIHARLSFVQYKSCLIHTERKWRRNNFQSEIATHFLK